MTYWNWISLDIVDMDHHIDLMHQTQSQMFSVQICAVSNTLWLCSRTYLLLIGSTYTSVFCYFHFSHLEGRPVNVRYQDGHIVQITLQ